jgi:hypothetical protein
MKKTARFLRKLADLFDPKISPSRDEITIRVNVDVEDATKDMDKLIAKSQQLAQITRRV